MVNKKILISGPKIYTEQGVLTDTALLIQDGMIQSIGASPSFANREGEVLSFPSNYHVIPGLIDMHVHGANGCDVMDATPEALRTMSQALATEGTTAFLATTMTADVEHIERTLMAVRDYVKSHDTQGAAILGIHLEGPFVSPAKMGAQLGDNIIPPDVSLIKKWQTVSDHLIKLVTLAPEQPQGEAFIRYLTQQNIIASIGHTNATYAEAMTAITAGCSHATHLFNAMRGIHQREPGPVIAALLSDAVSVEMIVDGIHLHPAIVDFVLKTKGKEKVMLVTDAMRAKCLSDGCYDLGGQTVHVKNGQAQLADGTLAGSVLSMPSAIQNTLKFTGCSLEDTLKMASENPAKALGLFHKKGSIAEKKDADLVVLDEAFNVVLTLCRGKVVFIK
jgi:N-acetylglucosamine-6-phosphate deacetylase